MKKWRVITSPEKDAYMNMAIDESLLHTYDLKRKMPVLRFYRWETPSISIGVSQKPISTLNLPLMKEDNIPFVRRMTGGEAIYHDDEVTYSIICSKDDLNLPNSVRESFRIITNFVLEAYQELGLKPYYSGDMNDYRHGEESAFCYATKEHFDVMVEGKKLGGNSQKRINDIIFQHGSIPMFLNLPEIKKYFREDLKDIENKVMVLSEACGRYISAGELILQLKKSFAKTFSVTGIKSVLSEKEVNLANALYEEKYKTEDWNYFRRTRIMRMDKE